MGWYFFTMGAHEAMPPHKLYSESVSSYADAYRTLAGALRESQVGQNGGAVGDWEGLAAEAYISEADGMKSVIGGVSEKIDSAAGHLDTLSSDVAAFEDTTLPGLHSDWDDKLDEAYKAFEAIDEEHIACHVDASVPVEERPPGSKTCDCLIQRGMVGDRIQLEQKAIVREYVSASNDLASSVSSAAGQIKGLMADIVPPDVMESGRDAIGAHLFSGGDTPLLYSINHWAEVEGVASRIAELVQDGELTADEIANKILPLLEDFDPTDPFLSAALLAHISPEEMIDLSEQLWTITASHLPTDIEPVQEFASILGQVMMVGAGDATGGENAALFDEYSQLLSLPADAGVHGNAADIGDRWRAGMIEQGGLYHSVSSDETFASRDQFGAANEAVFGWDHLTGLMYMGMEANPDLSFGDAFLNGDGAGNSAAHAMMADDYRRLQETDYGRSGERGIMYGTLSDSPFMGDPVSIMLEGLDGKAEHTQNFLASEVTFSLDLTSGYLPEPIRDGEASVARYLVGHRGSADSVFGAPDHGETLGQVLFDASNGDSEVNKRVALGALMGYGDALQADYIQATPTALQAAGSWFGWAAIPANAWEPLQGGYEWTRGHEHVFGARNDELRPWMAQIMNEHMDDLVLGLRGGAATSTVVTVDGESHIVVGKDLGNYLTGREGILTDLTYSDAQMGMADGGSGTIYEYLHDQAVTHADDSVAQAREAGGQEAADSYRGTWDSVITELSDPASRQEDYREHHNTSLRSDTAQAGVNTAISFAPFHKLIPGIDEIGLPNYAENLLNDSWSFSTGFLQNEAWEAVEEVTIED